MVKITSADSFPRNHCGKKFLVPLKLTPYAGRRRAGRAAHTGSNASRAKKSPLHGRYPPALRLGKFFKTRRCRSG